MDDWLNSELANIGSKPLGTNREKSKDKNEQSKGERPVDKNTPVKKQGADQKGFNLFKNTQTKFTINKDKLDSTKEATQDQPQIFKRPFDGTRGKFFKKADEEAENTIVQKMTQGGHEGNEIRTDKQVIVRPFSSKRGGALMNQIKKQEPGGGVPTGPTMPSLKDKFKSIQNKVPVRSSVEQSRDIPKEEEYGDDFDEYEDEQAQPTQTDFRLYAKKEKHINKQRIINLQAEQKDIGVSEERIAMQRQRVDDLHDLVCLETESFDCIFQMLPKKPYSLYVDRLSEKRWREIKSQTGEEQEDKAVQSDLIMTKEYQNQCPEDRSKYNLLNDDHVPAVQQIDLRFTKYLEFIQPVLEASMAHATQNTRSISTKYSFQAAWLPLGGLLKEHGMRLGDVYVPNSNGQVYKYVLLRAIEGELVLEFMNRRVTKAFYSPVQVTCISKTATWLVLGGQGGEVQVYNLNESESYHRSCRKGKQHQTLQDLADGEGLPVLRKASFSSDYLQEEEGDILAQREQSVPSRVVGLLPMDRSRLVVAQQMGSVHVYEVETLADDQQQRQYVDIGIYSRLRLKRIRRIDLDTSLLGVLSHEGNMVHLRSQNGLVKVDLAAEEGVVYNTLEEHNLLRNSIMLPSCHDQIYVSSPQEPDYVLVYSRKYSSLLKRVPLICPMKGVVKLQTLFLELKVKETQKRLKVDDQAKVVVLDKTGQLVVYCLLLEQVMAHMDFQKELAVELGKKQVHFRRIYASDLDMNYTMRILFHLTTKEVIDCHVNMIKFIERDYRLIKKRNQDLQTKLYQLL